MAKKLRKTKSLLIFSDEAAKYCIAKCVSDVLAPTPEGYLHSLGDCDLMLCEKRDFTGHCSMDGVCLHIPLNKIITGDLTYRLEGENWLKISTRDQKTTPSLSREFVLKLNGDDFLQPFLTEWHKVVNILEASKGPGGQNMPHTYFLIALQKKIVAKRGLRHSEPIKPLSSTNNEIRSETTGVQGSSTMRAPPFQPAPYQNPILSAEDSSLQPTPSPRKYKHKETQTPLGMEGENLQSVLLKFDSSEGEISPSYQSAEGELSNTRGDKTAEDVVTLLQDALNSGDAEQAKQMAAILAGFRGIQVVVHTTNADIPCERKYRLSVHVENHGDSTENDSLDVHPCTTINELKAKMYESRGFQPETQSWVIGGEIRGDQDTLLKCGIPESAILRLHSPASPGPDRQCAEIKDTPDYMDMAGTLKSTDVTSPTSLRLKRISENSGMPLPRACSWEGKRFVSPPNSPDQDSGRTVRPQNTSVDSRPSSLDISCSDQHIPADASGLSLMDDCRTGRSESTVESEAGKWNCSVCTYMNETRRSRCDMCETRRPAEVQTSAKK